MTVLELVKVGGLVVVKLEEVVAVETGDIELVKLEVAVVVEVVGELLEDV